MHQVELMVRQSCGSCRRVAKQIRPICQRWGAEFVVTDVDSDTSLAMEFGDRVPVVLVDDDEPVTDRVELPCDPLARLAEPADDDEGLLQGPDLAAEALGGQRLLERAVLQQGEQRADGLAQELFERSARRFDR